MKNSQPIIKKIIIPVIISEKEEFNLYTSEIFDAPFSRKTISNEVSTIKIGLNFASHDTIIAVKPLPPAVSLLREWSVPATKRKPAIPHIAPEIAIVLKITLKATTAIYKLTSPSFLFLLI